MLDGCWWHGCPEHFTMPKTNTEWWTAKFERNRERDQETDTALSEAGWLVLRFWEHEPAPDVATAIERQLQQCRASSGLVPQELDVKASGAG